MHTCELCLLSVMKAGGGEHVGVDLRFVVAGVG